jgi:glycosyltransferase involved in cell wall biosynthesis
VILASEGEGYGLPIIEASRHEVPIIARDIPTFREVAGQHAYYFSGLDPAALESAIRAWLTLRAADRHPTSVPIRGLTWGESARRLVDILFAREPLQDSLNSGAGSTHA